MGKFIKAMLLGTETTDYPNTNSKFNKNKKRLKEITLDYPLAVISHIAYVFRHLRVLLWFCVPYLFVLLLGILVFLTSIILVPAIITTIYKKEPKFL